MSNKELSNKSKNGYFFYFFTIGIVFSFLIITFLIYVIKSETTTYWKWWDSVDYSWEMFYVITPILPLFLIYPFLNATKQILKQNEENNLVTKNVILMLFGAIMVIAYIIVIFNLSLYEPIGGELFFFISQLLTVINIIPILDFYSTNIHLQKSTLNIKNLIALFMFIVTCAFGYIVHKELLDYIILAVIMIIMWSLAIILFVLDFVTLFVKFKIKSKNKNERILKKTNIIQILVLFVIIILCNSLFIYSNFYTKADPYLEYPINSLYLMVGFNLLLFLFVIFFFLNRRRKLPKEIVKN